VQKVDYEDIQGIPRRVLVKDGNDPETGIPLLDLSALGLNEEIEAHFYQVLWSQGIREYKDLYQPGAAGKVMAALRSAFKVAVSEVMAIRDKETKLLVEADYYDPTE